MPRAVFLSHASQDVDAVRRIAAAQLEWQSALQQVEQRLRGAQSSGDLQFQKGRLIVLTGQAEAAKQALVLAKQLGTQAPTELWLGDHDAAIASLAESNWA